ncbi:MAG: hypothetical protein M5R36_05675 [Deltaproteobacteria bacterium]|nr:hypothetical protein [Deltaproteobacteria bacterium]
MPTTYLPCMRSFLRHPGKIRVAADDDLHVDVAVMDDVLHGVEGHADVGAVFRVRPARKELNEINRMFEKNKPVVLEHDPVRVGAVDDDVAERIEVVHHRFDVDHASGGAVGLSRRPGRRPAFAVVLDAAVNVLEIPVDRDFGRLLGAFGRQHKSRSFSAGPANTHTMIRARQNKKTGEKSTVQPFGHDPAPASRRRICPKRLLVQKICEDCYNYFRR